MRLIEFICPVCGKIFEEFTECGNKNVKCPDCGNVASVNYSGKIYTSTGKSGSSCSGDCKHCSGCGK